MQKKYTSFEWAASVLPRRDANTHKGSFGKLLIAAGSEKYGGALHLAAESALRGGVGYLYISSEASLCRELRMKLPEVIYEPTSMPLAELCGEEAKALTERSGKADVTLVGCGAGQSAKLSALVSELISTEGGALVLDADALNSLSAFADVKAVFAAARRPVVITPHPLEFQRLLALAPGQTESERIGAAEEAARTLGAVVLLKGNGTVITDGENTYINTSGSSALAKAGSGDLLAGLLSSLIASTGLDALRASALAAYIHGRAADILASELSEYGVLISELPRQMARVINELLITKM